MSTKCGVAKRICDLEPRAVHMHCYGHALNLAAGDTLKRPKLMKDALETTREITKLIKYSPRRDGIFQRLKETLPVGNTPGIRVLCPTRWTVNAESIHSILANYNVLQRTWEESLQAVKDTETKAKIQGVAAQMTTFNFFFGSMLAELVLKHTDNLSRTLQHVSMSAAKGQQIAAMTVAHCAVMTSSTTFGTRPYSKHKNSVSMSLSCPDKERYLVGMTMVQLVETSPQHPRHTSSQFTLKPLT